MKVNEKLELLIKKMPESAHKIKIMQGMSTLMEKLKVSQRMIDDPLLADVASDFLWQFITAIGFTTAGKFLNSQDNPELKTASVFTAINAALPLFFNIAYAIKKNRNVGKIAIDFMAKFGSSVAMMTSFVATSQMAQESHYSPAKAAMVNAFATVAIGNASYVIVRGGIERAIIFMRKCKGYRPLPYNPEQEQEIEELKANILRRTDSVNSFYFISVIFLLSFMAFEDGAYDRLRPMGYDNPYIFNTFLMPILYALCSILWEVWDSEHRRIGPIPDEEQRLIINEIEED